MIKNKKIFTGKKSLLLALSGIGLFALSALLFIAVLHYASPRPIAASQPTDGACKLTDGLRVCLSSPKAQLASSDSAVLTITYTNTTDHEAAQAYECSHDPVVILNGRNLGPTAGCDGLSSHPSKMLSPGQTATDKFELSGSLLHTGDNTLSARWIKYGSGEVHIAKTAPAAQELAKQLTACQKVPDGANPVDAPHYCAHINVTLNNALDGQYNCAAWRALFSRIGLTLPCTSVMSIGVGFVYVPRDDATRWLGAIKNLPDVESAFIDTEYTDPLSKGTLD